MKRLPFVLRFRTGKREEGRAFIQANWARAKEALAPLGAGNLSVWGVGDFALCYGEYADETTPRQLQAVIDRAMRAGLDAYCELFAAPGTLPLMYHDIGVVREDKSLIRHRVFATHLKPGCAEEYKRRHDGLVAARGDRVTQGPESNFTIWNANGYIFGYCELVKILRPPHDRGGARLDRHLGDPPAGDHGLADRRRGLDDRRAPRAYRLPGHRITLATLQELPLGGSFSSGTDSAASAFGTGAILAGLGPVLARF